MIFRDFCSSTGSVAQQASAKLQAELREDHDKVAKDIGVVRCVFSIMETA